MRLVSDSNCTCPKSFQAITLGQAQKLISNFQIKKDKKLKESFLKELLFNYFQTLKNQLFSSIDQVCKSMIQKISNCLLSSQNLLEIYRKLHFKEFKDIEPQELRRLYQLGRNSSTYLLKEQQRLYQIQVSKIHQTIISIHKMLQFYQKLSRPYDNNFSPNMFFYKTIIQLTERVLKQKIETDQKQKSQMPIKIHISETVQTNHQPLNNKIGALIRNPQFSDHVLLNLEHNIKIKSTQSLRPKYNILNPNMLKIEDKKRLSKVSIAYSQDKSDNDGEHSFFSVQDHTEKKSTHNILGLDQCQISKKYSSSDIPQQVTTLGRPQIKKIPNSKIQCKCVNNIAKDNHQIRLNVMGSKMETKSNQKIQLQLNCKDCESVRFNGNPKIEKKFILNNKKIIYPPSPSNRPQKIKVFEFREDIQKKIIRLQIDNINLNNNNEVESPLLKKKNQSKGKRQRSNLLEVIKSRTISKQNFVEQNLPSNQELVLSDEELKSMALLIEALKLPSQAALKYLRKSLQFCPNNLSAAQYLSYLLIERNHPKQCLQLCNLMIAKIFTHTQNFELSVHVLINKAAALNLLGRFSETIQFVEKIMHKVQNATLFKNLADAYCALGIHEKSIQNYQKCLFLDNTFDEAFYNLAVCFYSQQNFQEAHFVASQALKLNSKSEQYIQLYRNIKAKLS